MSNSSRPKSKRAVSDGKKVKLRSRSDGKVRSTELTKERVRDLMTLEKRKVSLNHGCYMQPNKQTLAATLDYAEFQNLAIITCGMLNDKLGFIPSSNGITLGHLHKYLVRCFAWYLHLSGQTEEMPSLNASNFSLPPGVAVFFQSFAPYKDGESSLSRIVANVDDVTISALSPQMSLGLGYKTINVSAPLNEPQFFVGTPVTEAMMNYTDITSLISSMGDAVLVSKLSLVTNDPSMFVSSQRAFTTSYNIATTFNVFVLTADFKGTAVTSNKQAHLWNALNFIEWKPSITMVGAWRALKLDPEKHYVYNPILNMAWLGLMVADYLAAAQVTTNFWGHWAALYTLWATYYMSFNQCSVFLRTSLQPWFKNSIHRRIRTVPQIASLQKPTIMRTEGIMVVPMLLESPLAWVDTFGANHQFVLYGDTAGGFANTYFEGTSTLVPIVDLPVPVSNNVYNRMPLSVLDNLDEAIDLLGIARYSITNPKMVDCLCFAKNVPALDSEIRDSVTIHYRTLAAVACNQSLPSSVCCWMELGCMIQYEFTPEAKYRTVASDFANRIRMASNASILDSTTKTAVGQSRNVADSFMAVVKEQIFPKLGALTEAMTSQQARDAAADLYRSQINTPPSPTWEQVHSVITGNATVTTALAVLYGAAANYGPQVWQMFRNIRVNHVEL